MLMLQSAAVLAAMWCGVQSIRFERSLYMPGGTRSDEIKSWAYLLASVLFAVCGLLAKEWA